MLARLQPALLVVLPIGVFVLIWVPGGIVSSGLLWGLIVTAGGTALLAQFARDAGRSIELKLFAAWGGIPTTNALRYRNSNDKQGLNNLRLKLAKLMPNIELPSESKERENPEEADEIYDRVVAILRERTRNPNKFKLVHEENIGYGFRRNLLGMKPYGLTIVLISIAATWSLVGAEFGIDGSPTKWYEQLINSQPESLPIRIIGGTLNLIVLGAWIFAVNPDWVKKAAERYTERLFASVEVL